MEKLSKITNRLILRLVNFLNMTLSELLAAVVHPILEDDLLLLLLEMGLGF